MYAGLFPPGNPDQHVTGYSYSYSYTYLDLPTQMLIDLQSERAGRYDVEATVLEILSWQ